MPVAVLVSRAEYARLTHPKPGFVEFMRASPMVGRSWIRAGKQA
ncbi:MAG: hypothetical protein ACYCZ6_04230 [Polaromonas sp.]